MPYKSSKQRAWMHANKPALAKKWDKKYGTKIDKGFYGHSTVKGGSSMPKVMGSNGGVDTSADSLSKFDIKGQGMRPSKRDIVKNPPSQVSQLGQDGFAMRQPNKKAGIK